MDLLASELNAELNSEYDPLPCFTCAPSARCCGETGLLCLFYTLIVFVALLLIGLGVLAKENDSQDGDSPNFLFANITNSSSGLT